MSASSYQVLARRLRPRRFSDLTGQDVVVRTLQNALKSGQLAHAYLLTGIRGVGKTTIARLLAMVVNCARPEDGEPCGECESCAAILRGNCLDVQEMDAASHTGVDDIREILDSVRYPPTALRRKVYIIDEAHMLSRSAFNALLKTLEEPPDQVLFILATTEAEKLPVTVRSRCQRFDLRRLGQEEIANYLARVLADERIACDAEAVREIARAADGSVRDALSLAERVLAFAGDSMTVEDVRQALGLVGAELVQVLSEAVLAGRGKDAVRLLREAAGRGHAPRALLMELAGLWHELACLMADASLLEHEPGEARRRWLEAWAGAMDAEGLDLRYQVLVSGLRDMGLVDERQGAEMLLLRLAGLSAINPPREVPALDDEANAGARRPAAGDATAGAPAAVETPEPMESAAPGPSPEAPELLPPEEGGDAPGRACATWEAAVAAYHEVRPGVAAMLDHVTLLEYGERVRLALDAHQERAISAADRLAFAEWLGREVFWEPKGTERAGEAGESLSEKRAREAAARQRQLEAHALADPHVQALMENFDARLERVHAPGTSGDESAREDVT